MSGSVEHWLHMYFCMQQHGGSLLGRLHVHVGIESVFSFFLVLSWRVCDRFDCVFIYVFCSFHYLFIAHFSWIHIVFYFMNLVFDYVITLTDVFFSNETLSCVIESGQHSVSHIHVYIVMMSNIYLNIYLKPNSCIWDFNGWNLVLQQCCFGHVNFVVMQTHNFE